MGTVITGAVLVIITALILRNMIRNKKQGKSAGCGCSCSQCPGNCHSR